MYIRIQNNAIRYRISKDEAKKLIEGEKLIDRLFLTESMNLIYTISTTEDISSFVFISPENIFSLKINKHLLINELAERPSKSGVIIEKNNKINREVTLEIDIKKTR